MESVECLVVGAGVIGLVLARPLARDGREVIVVESENAIGGGISSRNSEVIHAWIYYPTGLAKTRLFVDGKAMLDAFCREFGVPHRRCGKLFPAVNAGEIDKLSALKAQAEANGAHDLVWIDRKEAHALEPALVAEQALLSPSSGIVDPGLHAGAPGRRRSPRCDDRVRNTGPRWSRRRQWSRHRDRRRLQARVAAKGAGLTSRRGRDRTGDSDRADAVGPESGSSRRPVVRPQSDAKLPFEETYTEPKRWPIG